MSSVSSASCCKNQTELMPQWYSQQISGPVAATRTYSHTIFLVVAAILQMAIPFQTLQNTAYILGAHCTHNENWETSMPKNKSFVLIEFSLFWQKVDNRSQLRNYRTCTRNFRWRKPYCFEPASWVSAAAVLVFLLKIFFRAHMQY